LGKAYTYLRMPTTKCYGTKGVRVLHIAQPDSGDAGHVFWLASEHFSRYLEAKPARFPIRGKRWIELGAGCGLIGLVLKHLGAAEVTITDLAAIVPNLRVNAQTNFPEDLSSGTLKIKALDWGCMEASEWSAPYDGIVSSDVLYLPQYFGALIQCMRALSSPRTVILLTGFIRGSHAHHRWVEEARDYFNIATVVEKKCIDDDGDDSAGLQHHEIWFVLKLTKKEETSGRAAVASIDVASVPCTDTNKDQTSAVVSLDVPSVPCTDTNKDQTSAVASMDVASVPCIDTDIAPAHKANTQAMDSPSVLSAEVVFDPKSVPIQEQETKSSNRRKKKGKKKGKK